MERALNASPKTAMERPLLTRTGVIVDDLYRTVLEIKSIQDLRKRKGRIDNASEKRLKDDLPYKKGRLMLDLLWEKNEGNIDFDVVIRSFPHEEMHPFSRNDVYFSLPTPQNPTENFETKANLVLLRSVSKLKGFSDVMNVFGDVSYENDSPSYFIDRTRVEIRTIFDMMMQPELSSERVRGLAKLKDKLVIDRLLKLYFQGDFPPNFDLQLTPEKINENDDIAVKLIQHGDSYRYNLPKISSVTFGSERSRRLKEMLVDSGHFRS